MNSSATGGEFLLRLVDSNAITGMDINSHGDIVDITHDNILLKCSNCGKTYPCAWDVALIVN